jgi:hypothetical protein
MRTDCEGQADSVRIAALASCKLKVSFTCKQNIGGGVAEEDDVCATDAVFDRGWELQLVREIVQKSLYNKDCKLKWITWNRIYGILTDRKYSGVFSTHILPPVASNLF